MLRWQTVEQLWRCPTVLQAKVRPWHPRGTEKTVILVITFTHRDRRMDVRTREIKERAEILTQTYLTHEATKRQLLAGHSCTEMTLSHTKTELRRHHAQILLNEQIPTNRTS